MSLETNGIFGKRLAHFPETVSALSLVRRGNEMPIFGNESGNEGCASRFRPWETKPKRRPGKRPLVSKVSSVNDLTRPIPAVLDFDEFVGLQSLRGL
jgi:hypothetical protein